jgi:peptidylprolyl isomerase
MISHPIAYLSPRPLLVAAFTSLFMCTVSHAQVQPQLQPQAQPKRAAAPAAAAPTRPAPPAAASPATSAAASATPRADGDIVARVAGRDITITEVRSFIAALGAREQVALARDPALLSQAVRLMLANQLVLKEAETKKWQDKPEIAVQLERVRDGAIAETYLQAVSTPPESYPDQADVQKAYDANKTAFVVPRQFRIAQIFVSLANGADKDAEEKARKKLAELQGKLKQPKADFAAVAKEGSDQQDTAERGGELGWVPETQIRPEIKTQVMGLANGAVTEPIKLDDGWHIIKLLETKPAETRPLADVRNAIVAQLRAQRAEAIRRGYLAKLLEQTPPAINELALTKIFENPADKAVTR